MTIQNQDKDIAAKVSMLKQFEKTSEFKQALSGEKSLTDQIEDYYGISTWETERSGRPGGIERHWTTLTSSAKSGLPSTTYLDIARCFTNWNFNENLLTYESVEKDSEANKKDNAFRIKLQIGSVTGIAAGAITWAIGMKNTNGYLCISGMFLMFSSTAFGMNSMGEYSYNPKNNNPLKSLDEYIHLNDALRRADVFIRTEYSKHFLQEVLR